MYEPNRTYSNEQLNIELNLDNKQNNVALAGD